MKQIITHRVSMHRAQHHPVSREQEAPQDCSWRDWAWACASASLPFTGTATAIFGLVIFRTLPEFQRGNCYKLSLLSPPFQNQTRTFSWYILASRTFGKRSNKTHFTERENFGGLHSLKLLGTTWGNFWEVYLNSYITIWVETRISQILTRPCLSQQSIE